MKRYIYNIIFFFKKRYLNAYILIKEKKLLNNKNIYIILI